MTEPQPIVSTAVGAVICDMAARYADAIERGDDQSAGIWAEIATRIVGGDAYVIEARMRRQPSRGAR
jgi:hypothetical protein